MEREATHSLLIGYALWIFGFTGAHRFYYGKPISGTIYFFTGGLFLVGWVFDLFYMPWLRAKASRNYYDGEYDYDLAWLLLTFVGVLGVHRFYLGKWLTGLLWLCSGGVFGLGYLYDYWTLNEQISLANKAEAGRT